MFGVRVLGFVDLESPLLPPPGRDRSLAWLDETSKGTSFAISIVRPTIGFLSWAI